jgi:hypothetical protein
MDEESENTASFQTPNVNAEAVINISLYITTALLPSSLCEKLEDPQKTDAT